MARFQLILAAKGNYFMDDIAQMYAEALRDVGHQAEIQTDCLPDSSYDTSIIVAPQEYVPLFLQPYCQKQQAEGHTPNAEVLKGQILSGAFILCVDQPDSPFFAHCVAASRYARGVLDISPYATAHWDKLGIPCLYLPLPFAKFSPGIGSTPDTRSRDLLFMGTDSARRMEFFAQHAELLDGWNAHLHFARHSQPLQASDAAAQFGKERTALLHDSRIMLNIHATRRPYFEWHRAMLAIAHGCVYVSESSAGNEHLVNGVHYLAGSIEELPGLCEKVLADPALAARIQRDAYDLLAEKFSHHQYLGNFVSDLQRLYDQTVAKRPAAADAKTLSAKSEGKSGSDSTAASKGPSAAPSKMSFFKTGKSKEPASVNGPSGGADLFSLGRKRGLEKDGKGVRVKDASCAMSLKPRSGAWPESFGRVEVTFAGDVKPRKVEVEIEEMELDAPELDGNGDPTGPTLFFRPRVERVAEGVYGFGVYFSERVVRCNLLLQAEPGQVLSQPTAVWKPLLASETSEVLENRFQYRFKEIQEVLDEIKPTDESRSAARNAASAATALATRQLMAINEISERTVKLTGGATVHVVHNDAYRAAGSPPVVSVVVTLFNYDAYVIEALQSVANSVFPGGPTAIELIVVDDASSDWGPQKVSEWMEHASIPVTFVRRLFNRGLADARNLGIEHTRGEYLFFLDADNTVLPHGIAKLWRRLSVSDSVAAYGMLAVFYDLLPGQHTEERQYLISAGAWDESRLAEDNYIDAMAMFRRQAMLDLGGYDASLAKRAAPGWEDYEMWLRILSRGQKADAVAEVIGMYRKHGNSMLNNLNVYGQLVTPILKRRYIDLARKHQKLPRLFGAPNASS